MVKQSQLWGDPWYYNFSKLQHASTGSLKRSKSTSQLAATQKSTAADLEEGYSEDAANARLCDSGLPDGDVCNVLLTPQLQVDLVQEAWSRGRWLLGLLVLQSMSSVVLEQYSQLLKEHLVVTLFLTMLVGAGGNAGNQSAIKVIRGLATGTIPPTAESLRRTLAQQCAIGFLLGAGLSVGGFVRVYVTNGSLASSVAISTSLFAIVMTSVLFGTGLPFLLQRVGVDPANAGTSIQVVMDIAGCLITCATCSLILGTLAKGLLA